MKAAQINAFVNKAKDMGLEDYVVFYTDCEVEGIIRMKSDTSVVTLNDANDCLVVLERNANPVRNTANEKPLMVTFVDYDHITHAVIAMTADELRENASQFEFEDEDIKRLIKVVSGTRATGYLREKDTGELPKIPGRAVDFELGTPYTAYVPEKEEKSDSSTSTEEPKAEEVKEEAPVVEDEVEDTPEPVEEEENP